MTPRPKVVALSGARALAADVVARVLDDNAWAQPALASALSASALDARDKALCTELTYGTLRWATALEKSLLRSADKPGRGLDKRMRPHLLVAAYQLQFLTERIPARAAVNEAVDAVRAVRPGLDGFANALLRKLGSPIYTTLSPTASIHDVADAVGVPHVLADAVSAALAACPRDDAREITAALVALNGRPTTYAYALDAAPGSPPPILGAGPEVGGDAPVPLAPGTPSSPATTPTKTAREFEAGTTSAAHAFVPRMFALEGGAVTDAHGFKDGAFVVVDPGSAVAALLVDARAGMRVLDLCAAPGGKTAILAHAVPTGRVIAVEQSIKRAERIRETLERTKLGARVELVVRDALTAGIDPGDAVLLDAPCSGFGTTRRKPEIKLRRTQGDVDAGVNLQRALLARAAELVKPGGVLVYSVCSPVVAEGPDQIDALLAARKDFTVVDARATLPWLPADAVDARGFVRLLPHRHDADAFFCARLVRR